MDNSHESLIFRALFAAISDALILIDRLGCIVKTNSAAQRMLGYSADEINGIMIESLIPDYYLAYRCRHHEHSGKRLADPGQSLFALRKDGSQLQIDIRYCDLQPHEMPYILVTLYDSSRYWRQIHETSENAESLRAMIDQAIVGIVRTDLEGNIMMTNNCFCAITGFSRVRLLGMNMLTLTDPDDRPRHFDLFQRMVDSNQSFTLETRYQHQNGEPTWVTISVSRISNAFRYPSSSVAVVMDITDRTLSAQALQASEERLKLAKSAAKLGIFDIDLTANKIQCDTRILDIWGFNSDEHITYEKLIAAIHPEDRAAVHSVLTEILKEKATKEYQLEYRVRHLQLHHETWVSVTGRVFYNDQKANRNVGIVQDISQRKLNEQKQRISRTAMDTLLKQQVATQTASAIAHELNQPLTAISAYSEVARKALNSDSISSDQLNRALLGSIEQAHRAGQTLHELLNFLQTNAIVSELIDINALIKETLNLVQNDGFGGFHTELQLEPDLPPVIANRLQVEMVLINLIRNGLEAMRGAEITAGTLTLTVRSVAEINMIQITLQDRGPGLETEVIKRIFEPFFTTKSGGFGMGLAISRSLIEANGGRLWFDLLDGEGAVFHFTLPFAA